MIDKLLKIQNVGLFANGTAGKPIQFRKVTLIYGGNGKGKSTLACLLRSWASGSAEDVASKKCLDAVADPLVHLLWKESPDHQVQQVKYENGSWSSTNPDVVVFDTQFVDDNVYSGFEVAAKQRQRLLEFAIGPHSVAIKREIDECDATSDQVSRRMRSHEAVLKAACGSMSLPEYIKATVPDDIDSQIDAANLELGSLKDVANIRARSGFETLNIPSANLKAIFEAFRKTLPGIEEEAEFRVKQHLSQIDRVDAEGWIKTGLSLITDDLCPFCDSPLKGLSIVSAYRSYFNEAYAKHKAMVERLVLGAEAKFGENTVKELTAQDERNAIVAQSWKAQVSINPPKINWICLEASLSDLQGLLANLSRAKQLSPLSKFGTKAEEQEAETLLQSIAGFISPYNEFLEEAQSKVASYLKTLSAGNVHAANKKLERLQALKRLDEPVISQARAGYLDAKGEHDQIKARKDHLRKQFNEEMPSLLEQYAKRINQQLRRFGAQFQIVDFKSTHQGGLPSSVWAIELRGARIDVVAPQKSASQPSFKTTLSDGDKRALAFAFFMARLAEDPLTKNRVVVVDDPVSSFDRTRTKETQRVLSKLALICKQIVVLSHDAYCIEQIDLKLTELKKPELVPAVLAIDMVESNYSVIVERSIEEETESYYATNYRHVRAFVDKSVHTELSTAARAIRPLLEGYLRRKYVGYVDGRAQLYQIIQQIRSAPVESPLYKMLPHANELEAIHYDVRDFHHDSGESLVADETEVVIVAKKALEIIHAA